MNSEDHTIVKHTAVGMCCAIGTMVVLSGCAYFISPDIKRGDQQLAAGKWEEASLAYKQALKDDPFNPTLQSKYLMAL
jgi:general secretion pathway protein D